MSASGAGSTGWQKFIDRLVNIERRLRELERPSGAQIRGTSAAVDALRESVVSPDGARLYTKTEVDDLIKTVNDAQVQLRTDLEKRIEQLEGIADGSAGEPPIA